MSASTKTGGRDATSAVVPGRGLLSIGSPKTPVPEGYKWTALAEVARMESGHTPSRTKPEYWNEGIPWIGIKDATGNDGRIIRETLQSVSQLGVDNSSTRLLPAGTVCLSRTASVGYVVQMGIPMCTSQDFVNWVCGPRLNPSYLRYLLLAEAESVRSWATGSTHKTLYFPEAKALHALLPPEGVQDRVVRVLGALDDKIAANRSVFAGGLELLNFRFESARRGAGKLMLSELAQVMLGGTPSRKVDGYWGGDVPWINSGACNSRVIFSASEMITRAGLEKSAAKILPAGTTCVAITGATLGQMGWLAVPMAANQSVVGVVAPPEDQLWLHLAVRAEKEQLMGWATGGAQQHVNKNSVGSLSVSYDSASAKNFGKVNRPLMERVVLAEGENEVLSATRDELLPLLMSGKITVKDAEKTVEEVV